MQNLPLELRSIIASYLDDKSRRVMRLANMEWFKTIKYSDFKFYFTTDEQLPQILARLAQYSWSISVGFNKQKFKLTKENCEDIGKLTHLTGLHADLSKADPHPFTNLTNLEYLGEDYPREINKHLTKLKSMVLRSMEEAMKVDLERFTNLESIDWVIHDDDADIDPLYILRNAYRLTRLEMEIDCAPLKMDENNLTRFTNLKRLVVRYRGKDINIPYLPNLEALEVNGNNIGLLSPLQRTLTELKGNFYMTNLSSLATLTNLKKLNIPAPFDDILSSPQGVTYLAALTNLENLVWHPKYSQPLKFITSEKFTSLQYLLGELDMQYIAKHGNKLQSLTVRKITIENSGSLQFFSNLTRLWTSECRKDLFPIIEKLIKLEDLYLVIAQDPTWTEADVLRMDKLTDLKSLVYMKRDDTNPPIDNESFKNMQLTKLEYKGPVNDNFLEKIAAMTSLQYIRLSQAHQLTDNSILLLAGLTNLTGLLLTVSDKMTGVTLTLLTSLQSLNVTHTGSYSKFIKEATLQQRMTRLISVDIRKLSN